MKRYLLPALVIMSLLCLPAAGAAGPRLVAQQQDAKACEGTIGGYDVTVDTEHSSLKAGGGVCNYIVESKDDQAVSGLAITVAYGCEPELQEAWKSRTSRQRDAYTVENGNGEVSRSATSLLLREDRQVSGFSGTHFVQQRLFLLQLPNTSITIVVHTDAKQPKGDAEPNPLVLDFDATKAQALAQSLAAKFLTESLPMLPCAPPVDCPAVDAARGEAVKLYSIPKDQETYRLETVFGLAGGKKVAEPFDDLNGKGTIRFAVGWQDRNKARQTRCFDQPVNDVWNLSDSQIAQAARDGYWNFRRVVATEFAVPVDIRYRVLDELDALVRDPKNAQQTVNEGKGEKLLRGSALEFDTQIFVYDQSQKQVAKSDPAKNVKLTYEVRHPVVFVPGTAGSRLFAGGREIWPQPIGSGAYGLTSAWASMRLEEDGSGPAVTADEVFRCYLACAVASVYQGWLDHMAALGYVEGSSLLLFPYDWRLDITKHPANLDAVVDKALELNYNRRAQPYSRSPDDKVIIITHSQGGLVARAYTADQQRANKVAYMIQTAPTNYGSLKALKAGGMTGYSFETPFLDMQVGKWMARNYGAAYFQFPVAPDGTGNIDQVLFDESDPPKPIPDTQAVLNGMRTFMFCDRGLRDEGMRRLEGNIEPCAVSSMNTKVLADAVAFHASLPSPVDLGVPTFVIAGTDQPTIVGYRRTVQHMKVLRSHLAQVLGAAMPPNGFTGTIPVAAMMKVGALPPEVFEQAEYRIVATEDFPAANDAAYTVELPYFQEVYRSCGDNLVPLHRAVTLPGVEAIYVKGVTHGGMTEDKTVQALLDRLLSGVRPVELEKPTCSSLPTGVTEGVSITASESPANLHVYDSQGRHTGLRPDGTVELGIPGSVFDTRSGTQQITLPPTKEQLRVTFEGLVDTDFNVRIVAGDGATEKSVEYLAVPETTASNAEITFSASKLGEGTELKVDKENDGTFEETLKPSFVTTASGGQAGSAPSTGTESGGSMAMIAGGALAAAAALAVGGGLLLLRRRRKAT